MRRVRFEMVEHAHEVVAEVVVGERPLVVVAQAVAARIPRHRMEMLGEGRQLVAPVGAVAADAVQEDDQRALAHAIDRDARRRADMLGLAGVALPPF